MSGHQGDDDVLGRAYDQRLMGRLLRHAASQRRTLATTALLLPVLALADLAPPYLVKVAIDDHIVRADWTGMPAVAFLLASALAAQCALRYVTGYLMIAVGQRVVHDLRLALFAHVQRLPAAFFDRTPVGRLMTRILNDVEAVGELFASGFLAVVGDALTLAGVVVVLVLLDWRLALVTLSVVPVLFAVAAYFRTRARNAYREVRNRIARVNAYLQENIVGVTVVQLFGREAAHAAEFARLNEAHRRSVFRRMGYDASLYAGVEVIGATAIAALLWWGGGQILAGALTFGVLVAFMEYTHRFFLPIRDLSAKYTVMQSAMVSAERIFSLLDSPPAPAGSREASGDLPPGGAGVSIEFREVWFAYPPPSGHAGGNGPTGSVAASSGAVLRGLSFRVEPGERVAVVGATGAGKSTLARLLTRVYEVDRGAILVDGRDVREWDTAALRRTVGLVLQDAVVFAGTLAENISFGRPDATRVEVESAGRRARLDGLVRSLPHGWDEVLRERGANLSQGQRQLLAVARALVYNPVVLVLDEATSSVDPETEVQLQRALDELLAGRTSVIIAHRFSTIQRVDRILVIHKGRLREQGTHQVLLRAGGLYATLHALQQGESSRCP